VIDWQEQHHAIAFQCWYSCDPYDPYDSVLLPFAPTGYEPASLDNVTAFDVDDTILENLVAHRPNPTPDSVSAGSTSKSSLKDICSKPGSSSASSSRVEKRKANTLAARRYRQNRLDKVAELESALKATQLERDALKVQVAKLQGETRVLKDLVRGEVKRPSMLAWSA
jgi:Basic region leucine zipper